MDKKIKIVVIIIFAVFIAGITFDANNKMKALKEKKKPAAQEVQNVAQTQQPSQENQMNTDKQTFDAMESRAQFAAQNTAAQPPQPPEENYTDEERLEEIEEPAPLSPRIDKASANTYFTFKDINLSVKESSIPDELKAVDGIGNKYYFISNSNAGTNSLGMLIKVSPTRNLLWQKEIKSFFTDKPGVQYIKATSNSIQVNLSKAQGRASVPVIFSQSGTSVSNPYSVKFYTSAGRAPSDFAVTYIDSFSHKDAQYALISVIDIKPKNRGVLTSDEIYAYKLKNGNLNKQYRILEIPYFLTENNSSRLSFIIKDEGTGVLFIATAPKTERNPAYTNAVRIPSIELTRSTPQVQSGAPTVITEGIIVSNSNHDFTFEYKE